MVRSPAADVIDIKFLTKKWLSQGDEKNDCQWLLTVNFWSIVMNLKSCLIPWKNGWPPRHPQIWDKLHKNFRCVRLLDIKMGQYLSNEISPLFHFHDRKITPLNIWWNRVVKRCVMESLPRAVSKYCRTKLPLAIFIDACQGVQTIRSKLVLSLAVNIFCPCHLGINLWPFLLFLELDVWSLYTDPIG